MKPKSKPLVSETVFVAEIEFDWSYSKILGITKTKKTAEKIALTQLEKEQKEYEKWKKRWAKKDHRTFKPKTIKKQKNEWRVYHITARVKPYPLIS